MQFYISSEAFLTMKLKGLDSTLIRSREGKSFTNIKSREALLESGRVRNSRNWLFHKAIGTLTKMIKMFKTLELNEGLSNIQGMFI